jgi:cardiolipin synthase A/B
VKAGVAFQLIGKVEKGHGLEAEPLPGKRQHLRCILRDGRAVFVGSQSLRKPELDARREIGLIARDSKLVRAVTKIFEEDWAATEAGRKQARQKKKQDERADEDGKREALAESA